MERPSQKLDFTNTAQAYKSKSTGELFRTLAIFKLCTIGPLVENSEKLLKFSRGVFGDTLTSLVLKYTFFQHFCAGEDGESIRPKVERLRKSNVGGILDYAAEADVGEQVKDNPAAPSTATAVLALSLLSAFYVSSFAVLCL